MVLLYFPPDNPELSLLTYPSESNQLCSHLSPRQLPTTGNLLNQELRFWSPHISIERLPFSSHSSSTPPKKCRHYPFCLPPRIYIIPLPPALTRISNASTRAISSVLSLAKHLFLFSKCAIYSVAFASIVAYRFISTHSWISYSNLW